MRVLLIAMSGVRAWSEELNRAKMTMPGVLERGEVIASLPSLGLLTLAGLTPPGVHVEYHEIADIRKMGEGAVESLAAGFDLVAISTFTAQVCDAYEVAARCRRAGAKVVMGGLHVTVLPEEALGHCDAVVIGEAEPLWGRVLEDAKTGELRQVYRRGPGEAEFDLASAPMPRFDLLEPEKYNRLTVQTSRGCPHACEFCASSILLTSRYKLKPVSMVIDEVRAIARVWSAGARGDDAGRRSRRPFIEFADDNSFVHREHYKSLCRALIPEKIKWFTETDISVARDPELLDLMREAGCREVLIGLESPTPRGLDRVESRRNWKLRQLPDYESGVRSIQSRGIAVNGCFILGLDGDDERVFGEVADFAQRTSLFDVQLTVPTPFPGTRLRDRLRSEGRLLHDDGPEAWKRCTLFDVDFVPRGMSADRLQRGLVECAGRVYDPAAVKARRDGFFAGVTHARVRPDAWGQPEAA